MMKTLMLLTGLMLVGCCPESQTITRTDTLYTPVYVYLPARTDSSGTVSLNKDSTEVRFVMKDSTVITYKVLPKDKERLARAVDSLKVLNGMLSSYVPKDSVLAYLRSIEKEVTVTKAEESSWLERQIWKLIVIVLCLAGAVIIVRKAFGI